MNSKALRILEYNKIINMLIDAASSDLGKELCRNLMPMTSLEDIKAAQKETADALFRIVQKGSTSFSGLKDIGLSIKRLQIGANLGMLELLNISSMLKIGQKHMEGEKQKMREETVLTVFLMQSNHSHLLPMKYKDALFLRKKWPMMQARSSRTYVAT